MSEIRTTEIDIVASLQQSRKDDEGYLWEVAVIGEGPGLNSQRGEDGHVYQEYFTRESIVDLTEKLEGVKVKAFRFNEGNHKEKRNHLPQELDTAFGHRLVENNVGVLESPKVVDINGKAHAFANLRLSTTEQALWLKDMLLWAQDSGHPDYVGLSINSSGQLRPRINESTRKRYIDIINIDRPKSVDVVDMPAAKGEVKAQFVRLLQSYIETHPTEQESTENNTEQVNISETLLESVPTNITVPQTVVQNIDSLQESSNTTPEQNEEGQITSLREDVTTETAPSVSVNDANAQVYHEVFQQDVYAPIVQYLQSKNMRYYGDTVYTLIESLDMSGLPAIDQAVLRQLAEYEKLCKINAARELVHDLIDTPILTSQHTISQPSIDAIAVETLSTDDGTMTAGQEELTKEMPVSDANQEEHVALNVEIPLSHTTMSIETMANEVQGTEQMTSAGNAAASDIAAPVIASDVKQDVQDVLFTRLNESLSKFSAENEMRTKLLEQQMTSLREDNERLRKTEEAQSAFLSAMSDFKRIQEQNRMDSLLNNSGLFPEVIQEIKEEVNERILTNDELNRIVERKKRLLARIQESTPGLRTGNVNGLGIGYGDVRIGADAPDKLQVAMDRCFGVKNEANPAWSNPGLRFSSLKEGYIQITGDYNLDGVMHPRFIREGVIGADTFEKTLSNTMNRYLVTNYETFDHSWRKLVRIRKGIRDYKTQEMNRIGGFTNLKPFYDTGANPSPTGYIESNTPVEKGGSFVPIIRGKLFTITEQMLKNDDMFLITRLLEESARAADETLMTFVYSLLVGGAGYLQATAAEYVPSTQINTDDIYSNPDLRKLYASDNSGTTAFDYWPLLNSINGMKRMRKMGNQKPLKLAGKKYLVVPYELENHALRIHPTNTDKEPGGTLNDANILPRNLEIIAVDRMYLGDDANNWYLVEDPMNWEGIQVGFVDDDETPRIVLANNPTAGRTFSHGGLQYAVSHRYGGGIAAHEGLFASIVTG